MVAASAAKDYKLAMVRREEVALNLALQMGLSDGACPSTTSLGVHTPASSSGLQWRNVADSAYTGDIAHSVAVKRRSQLRIRRAKS